ncbi:hypothetical protein YC2023_000971 [Brassica napus]
MAVTWILIDGQKLVVANVGDSRTVMNGVEHQLSVDHEPSKERKDIEYIGSAMTYRLLARLIQGFTWSSVHGEDKIDISESKSDLFMAKPLHAIATPRLAPQIYST